MKIFKIALLGVTFLCGLTAFSINAAKDKAVEKTVVNETIPCTTIYTLCDFGHPDPNDFEGFSECMIRNGCG